MTKGRLNPEEFLDQVDRVNQFFEWKDMPEYKKSRICESKDQRACLDLVEIGPRQEGYKSGRQDQGMGPYERKA